MGKPEIRFKGFTDDWEQRKFPEFVSFFNGLTYTPDDVQDTGTLVLRSSNVKNGEIVDADNVYVSDKVVISENVQKGDIIVVVRNGSRALIGKHAQIKAFMPNTVIGAFMTGLRSEQSSFVNALLDTSAFEKEIAKNMGATINQITGYMFSKMEFMIPSEKEQQKIGDYFTNLDHLITLHQRKCDEVKTLKKYMLQKMFPQNGMNVPEIRFSGFTDVWEQRKLGEVIEDYVEKTTVENQYPVLTSSQQMGIVLQDDYFSGDRVSQSGNIGYFVIPRGYFAYRSRSDNDVFVFNRNDCIDKGSISYFYPVFKPSGVDSDFLLRRLNYGLETQLKIASEGTGQHVLSLKKFKNMTALFPSINEQRKIGEYFTRLDHLITLHQRKCDELRKMKKFMLQNMFPKD